MTGQLLGAHMVGAEVTELIQGFVVAINLETTEEDLIQSVFPHPTLSEMIERKPWLARRRAGAEYLAPFGPGRALTNRKLSSRN